MGLCPYFSVEWFNISVYASFGVAHRSFTRLLNIKKEIYVTVNVVTEKAIGRLMDVMVK